MLNPYVHITPIAGIEYGPTFVPATKNNKKRSQRVTCTMHSVSTPSALVNGRRVTERTECRIHRSVADVFIHMGRTQT